ncbi:MAG: 5-(carboxyamino)imidazole ribonucleotide synthase [Microcoleus sp. PH2017_29_MFU_D_A]|uniref:5-(carboxyamino)imidazole ribonucleotide synthase n=1 Tax=unclassified Microcoleus TaxID=2642155 RepID=UPI001D519F45|nr:MULTISPECIES: 5-(carboxyamino)imidazole ribonucleotide synthase [unclassified Microcoleus]MCC3417020.1 5-(carboxyamino)imidazole ribonucleotide synthase [Microcoleus sp. PH2017_07_MST_O_A]MCC3428863.1 5-(carboxyamino)imidazole ribonucleotide synthase [Microcoleus sp. PH2017_04_SCI_O_A]MCC3465168.1 5-(carboxyamino)imidazole ribonucleotide synthase [Microcoleus sp. PH2017_06_SFM_O_A]MCC3509407.1 5-(carboxyamino)imidazole ribonucleotide synthase [Microcoleus sp. PH2017_17_BER_D_A]MCC3425876.1 
MKSNQTAASSPAKLKRVGVVGGGQLAWMMGEAASALGIELVVQTPNGDDPAVSAAVGAVLGAVDDVLATAYLADGCDVITFENEFVDLDGLRTLEQQGVLFQPSLSSLSPLLDKYVQRCYLQRLGLPTPRFWAPDSMADLDLDLLQEPQGRQIGAGAVGHEPMCGEVAIDNLAISVSDSTQIEQNSESGPRDFPFVVKVRRHGYDGQGTFIVKDRESFESISATLKGQSLLVEEFVPFDRELAAIAARSVTGEIAIYPIVETQQQNQVCRVVIAPADISLEVQTEACAIARTLLNSLEAVGVFGIELFLTADNKLLVNEIAPRTHNSGHFTIDACKTSQFEQHLRAVCQLPLGNCDLKCAGAVMVNLLGYESAESDYLEKRKQLAQISGAFVHWYGKKVSRPGRKLGHVTVLFDGDLGENEGKSASAIAQTIESIWYGS